MCSVTSQLDRSAAEQYATIICSNIFGTLALNADEVAVCFRHGRNSFELPPRPLADFLLISLEF